MASIIIALGSNSRQAVHIEWASQRLATLFADVRMSRKLWTHDVKGSGRMYMNRLMKATTSLGAEEINTLLKQLEKEVQRTHDEVTIDLDLMQYDSEQYHPKDWPRPYIQQLIPDIL